MIGGSDDGCFRPKRIAPSLRSDCRSSPPEGVAHSRGTTLAAINMELPCAGETMRKIVPAALAFYLAIAPHTCKQIGAGSGVVDERAPSEPLIKITPLRPGREARDQGPAPPSLPAPRAEGLWGKGLALPVARSAGR